MLIHGGGQEAFFEISATLIPVFLVGGVLVETLRPQTQESSRRIELFNIGIPFFGATAILAEVLAISSLITGSATTLDRVVVAAVLASSMILGVCLLWGPWLERSRRLRRFRSRSWEILGAAALIVAAFFAVHGMVSDSGNAFRREHEAAYLANLTRNDGSTAAVENRIVTLEVAYARVKQELIAAGARNEPIGVINSLFEEEDGVIALIAKERRKQRKLVLHGINLVRRHRGESPLGKLPSYIPPVQTPNHYRIVPNHPKIAE